jgi:hypothetical protein
MNRALAVLVVTLSFGSPAWCWTPAGIGCELEAAAVTVVQHAPRVPYPARRMSCCQSAGETAATVLPDGSADHVIRTVDELGVISAAVAVLSASLALADGPGASPPPRPTLLGAISLRI